MNKKIIVYSTPTCSYCVRAKQFLKDNNILFEHYDVSADQEKAEEMIQKSGQMGVPVLDIEGEIIIGFDKGRVKELLGIDEKN
jgi:glutaredoxin 3